MPNLGNLAGWRWRGAQKPLQYNRSENTRGRHPQPQPRPAPYTPAPSPTQFSTPLPLLEP